MIVWWIEFKRKLGAWLGYPVRVVRVPVPNYYPVSPVLSKYDWQRLASIFEREEPLRAYIVSELMSIDKRERSVPPAAEYQGLRIQLSARRAVYMDLLDLPHLATLMAEKVRGGTNGE